MCSEAFILPSTGEDKHIRTSVNLTMCKAQLKILVLWKTLVLNSNRQKKENMSRYLYNIGVAPNSGHKYTSL